jgi:predicted DsbA family dithiol-disulfide isomerase
MARLAYQFAAASDRVRADVVEASEFPELSRRYGVRAVPKSVLNDSYEVMGSVRERDLLEMVVRAGTETPESPPA